MLNKFVTVKIQNKMVTSKLTVLMPVVFLSLDPSYGKKQMAILSLWNPHLCKKALGKNHTTL